MFRIKEQNVIFVSSAAVYGEASGEPLIETDMLNPKTQYGLAKYMAERIYQYYSETMGFQHNPPVSQCIRTRK